MEGMFSYLYYTIFPTLGQWIGFVRGLAMMPFLEFVRFFLEFPASGSAFSVEFMNVFNGSMFKVITPMGFLYNTMQGLSGPLSVLDPIAFLSTTIIIPFLHNLTTLFAETLLVGFVTGMGLSAMSPTWVIMLALSPILAIALGFVKHCMDVLPIV